MIARALKLTTRRLFFQQPATAVVVFLLFLVWLRVPDSSWIYVIATLLASGLLIAAFGIGETSLLCRLTSTTPTRSTYLRGTVILLAGFAIWFGWDALMSHLASEHDGVWAGYWNSRFPASMRNIFSYEHITTALIWIWTLIDWAGAGLLAVTAFHLIATPEPKPAIQRNLRSVSWWLVFLVGVQLVLWLTGKITGWTPGHGLAVETMSFFLRTVIVVGIETVFTVFLLATMATFAVRESEV